MLQHESGGKCHHSFVIINTCFIYFLFPGGEQRSIDATIHDDVWHWHTHTGCLKLVCVVFYYITLYFISNNFRCVSVCVFFQHKRIYNSHAIINNLYEEICCRRRFLNSLHKLYCDLTYCLFSFYAWCFSFQTRISMKSNVTWFGGGFKG